MASEVPSEGSQDRQDDQKGHQRRNSELLQDGQTPDQTASTSLSDQRGGGTPNVPIDLTGDAHDPRDASRKHVRDGEPHDPEISIKRLKMAGDHAAISEKPSTPSPASPASTVSGDEILCSKVELDRLLKAEAKSQQELKDKDRALELERAANLETSQKSVSKIKDLRNRHEVSQQKLQDDHEQQVRKLQAKAERDIQFIVSQKDQAYQALEAQAEAVRHEKESVARSQAQELHAIGRELEATKEELTTCNTQLKDAQHEIQAAQMDQHTLRELCDSKKEVNKKLENRNRFLEKRCAEVKEKLKTLETAHESDKAQFNARIKELQAQMKELQANLDSQTEQHHGITNALLQQLRDSQGLSQRYNFKVSDEEIIEQWGSLRHNLRQFIDRYTRPIQLSQQQLHGTWTKLSPVISELAASPLLSAFAWEAYLWDWLFSVVFCANSLVWAGSLGRSFTQLSNQAAGQLRGFNDEPVAEYHSWRATSSNILSRLSERAYNHELYHGDVHALVERLYELLGPDFIKDNASQELIGIVNDARDFEIMRRKLKSCIEISFTVQYQGDTERRYDVRVDNAAMRRRDPEVSKSIGVCDNFPGTTVKLIVSPTIVRWGNSNGTDYDRSTCLVKMDVLFSQSPDIVPSLTAQPDPTTGDEELGRQSNVADGTPPSKAIKRKEDTPGERKPRYTTPSQLAVTAKAATASTLPNKNSRPPRAAKTKVRKKCYNQQKEEPEEDDELTGNPSDFEETKPHLSKSKKPISTNDGENGQ